MSLYKKIQKATDSVTVGTGDQLRLIWRAFGDEIITEAQADKAVDYMVIHGKQGNICFAIDALEATGTVIKRQEG